VAGLKSQNPLKPRLPGIERDSRANEDLDYLN